MVSTVYVHVHYLPIISWKPVSLTDISVTLILWVSQILSCKKFLSSTTLCVDNDKWAMKALRSMLSEHICPFRILLVTFTTKYLTSKLIKSNIHLERACRKIKNGETLPKVHGAGFGDNWLIVTVLWLLNKYKYGTIIGLQLEQHLHI